MVAGQESKTRALCGGRVMVGEDVKGMAVAMVLLVAPTVLYFVFEAPFWWIFISPALPIFVALLFIHTVASFFVTALSDPGIIPRKPAPHEDDSMSPMQILISVKGTDVTSKHCFTCNYYRPPRCSHCSFCNNCVDCPWLANCVGRRNYKTFLMFVFEVMLYGIFIFAQALARFVMYAQIAPSALALFQAVPVSFVLMVYSLAGVLSVGYLGIFHCQLIAASVTTNELLLSKYASSNPYKKSYYEELTRIMFLSTPPSFYRLSLAETKKGETKKKEVPLKEVVSVG